MTSKTREKRPGLGLMPTIGDQYPNNPDALRFSVCEPNADGKTFTFNALTFYGGKLIAQSPTA